MFSLCQLPLSECLNLFSVVQEQHIPVVFTSLERPLVAVGTLGCVGRCELTFKNM